MQKRRCVQRFGWLFVVGLLATVGLFVLWPMAHSAQSSGAGKASIPGVMAVQSNTTLASDEESQTFQTIAKTAQFAEIEPYLAALRPALMADVGQAHMADWPRYDLALKINPVARQVVGTQQVIYTNRETAVLKDIALRLYPNTQYMDGQMDLTDVRVNDRSVKARFVTRNGRMDRSMVLLSLPEPLAAGQSLTLSMALTVTAPLSPTTGYRTFGMIDGMLSLPNVYAMIAPREKGRWRLDSIPLFGDVVVSVMALYRAHIDLPNDYTLVATGMCKPDSAGIQVCVSGPARDFAMQVNARYRVHTTTLHDSVNGDVVIYSYCLPQHDRAGERALGYAAGALKSYERRFGLYPYRELKVFETTTIAGGIEYPMLAGITDSNYELETNINTNTNGNYFEWLIAHEVAHQWWYNMVGSNPITEAWLDESLTQYSASLYIEDRYGEAAARAQRDQLFSERYDKERKSKGDRRVGQPTDLFPRWSYFPIVYGKGPLFFEEVRHNGGDARFEAWLRTYFVRYRYDVAQADDLLRVAADVGLADVARTAHDRWILGRR